MATEREKTASPLSDSRYIDRYRYIDTFSFINIAILHNTTVKILQYYLLN